MKMKLIAAIAATIVAGAAAAQSHSVTNMANPPQTQSDTKEGTAATPGKTATAQHNTSKQKDTNAGARQHAKKAATADTDGARVHAGSSATAIKGSGAGNGDRGAEGAMELKPSDATLNQTERKAFDSAPNSGKK